ncbi:threonine--tRNA ligase, partial [Patescibacteria group bacterium]|nr:threonine--tRNA ligase [Patescibacteria group bacterium]
MNKQKNSLDKMRHSCSHLMAAALQSLYPKVQFGIGPSIETGFYYDVELPEKISDEDLIKIEEKMRELADQNIRFEKKEVSINEGLKIAKELGQKYKIDLLKGLKDEGEKKVTFYKLGDFID